MNTKTPECWASDAQARAIRIEISTDYSLLLTFDQFIFSELKHDGKKQELRLVFVTHEVLVRGHALRKIETALQRMELATLSKLIGNQLNLIPEGQPAISEIGIKAIKEMHIDETAA